MQLGTGCLVLLPGDVRDKVEMAIKFSLCGCHANPDDPATLSVTSTALSCLLLSIAAVFDLQSATEDQLQSSASIVTSCIEVTAARLFSSHGLSKSDSVVFESQMWPWIEANTSTSKAVPWIKLLDSKRWPGTKRLMSPTKASSSPTKWGVPLPLPDASEASASALSEVSASDGNGDEQYDDDAPEPLVFRFSTADGGVLVVAEDQAVQLYDLLLQSAFTKVHPQAMYDTFVQHTGDGLLEEETFLEAIEELVSMTDKQHLMHDNTFLENMLDLFRSFLPEKSMKVDAFEIAAGFSLMTWGSKSDKLASAFHYFDVDSKGFLNRQQLWRFLRSVLITLLYLSPPEDIVFQRYTSLAELVDTGEEDIMESIMDGIEGDEPSGDEENDEDFVDQIDGDRARTNSDLRMGMYSFEDFGYWYNAGGFKGMSWLELLDLRKWAFVSPEFTVEGLDVSPIDPVVASTNYYTANNIQVDVESDPPVGHSEARFAFAGAIDEGDDEEENDSANHRQQPKNRSVPPSSSLGSASTVIPSRDSSAPTTLPAICLKNEIVLEFDLPFDSDDDATTELPITTLSFDNGDLIQYFELQRVVKLNQVELYRLYRVFEPYMEDPATSCIDKSRFDFCVRQLLPPAIADAVAAEFGVHTNARVPPRSVGRGNDSKMVADTLSRIFFAFNRGGTGKIDLIEFVSAFTIFCAGSKSEKLAFAYRLFDTDRDGCLTRREMWKYLRSFLTMLLALGNGSELSAEAIASVADTTAIEIADTIFRDTNKTFSTRHVPSFRRGAHRHSLDTPESANISRRNGGNGRYEHRGSLPDETTITLGGAASNAAGAGAGSAFVKGGVVSFEEFAVWYSKHGNTIISWVELLDSKKWPEVSDSVAEAILRYINRQQQALANATEISTDQPISTSSNDTVSSHESGHRGRSSSMEAAHPDTENSIFNSNDDAFAGDRDAIVSGMDAVSGIAHLITSPTSSSSPNKDLSSVALQFKLTSYDNTSLRIRLKDVAIVYTISERMNLSRMACGEMAHLLKKYAHGRSLTKQGFLRAMRDLVPRDELSNEDQEFLSFHLLRIFTLFESESVLSNGDSSVPSGPDTFNDELSNGYGMSSSSVGRLQLLAGMAVFCGTSKSAKLGVLFKLYDTQGDGRVSRRHLFEMLKSILVVLFAFSSYNASKGHSNDTSTVNSWSTNSIAERAAGAVISKLFCEASCKRSDAISLAEFAAWYAAGGYMDCPWLELLDLSKWPAKEAFEASKREKPLIYAFDMLEEGNILHFTESDISTYLFVLRCTQLSDLSVSKLYDALLAYATPSAEEARNISKANQSRGGGRAYSYAAVEEDEGAYLVLTRSNFYQCIRSLVAREGMSEKAQQTSSKLLSRVFNVFDRKRCGRVNALELACGMSILGKGSKSQKLSLAFDFITKMRQQRQRTLNNYASTGSYYTTGGGGGGGFGYQTTTAAFGLSGVGGGVTSNFSTNGFGFASVRAAAPATSGTRRAAPLSELNALPHSVLFIYLRSFLLALMALSDGTYRLGLEKIYEEADEFIEEAMGDLMTDVAANGGGNATTVASTSGFAGYGSVRSRMRVTFEQFGEWYNTGGYQLISWVELLDVGKWQQQQDFQEQASMTAAASVRSKNKQLGSQRQVPASTQQNVQPIVHTAAKPVTKKRQIRQSDIVSTPYVQGIPSSPGGPPRGGADGDKNRRISADPLSLGSDGPIMVFAIAKEAAELQFFNDDISRLRQFIRQSQIHTVHALDLEDSMEEALQLSLISSTTVTTKDQFVRAIRSVCGNGTQAVQPFSEDSLELLYALMDVFVREAESVNGDATADTDDDDDADDRLDLGAIVSGLLVICKGNLLEKLQCGALILDERAAQDAENVATETLKSTLMCFLMAFYGMCSSLSAELVRYSAELGAESVIRDFQSSEISSSPSPSASSAVDPDSDDEDKPLEPAQLVSLSTFCRWFNEAGYRSHPWLELAELQHWPATINVCGTANALDDDDDDDDQSD